MQNFMTALKAEHIKKRGTGTYVLALILGSLTPIISSIVTIVEKFKQNQSIPYNYYLNFIQDNLDSFTGFFFPLLIIITASRITQLDHKNGGWQLMETQPLQKLSIYFSKFTVLLIANLICIISMVAFSYIGAAIISLFIDIPAAATTEFAFAELFWLMARLFIAGLFFTVFQYFVSVLISSFIWSILIGFFVLLLHGILALNKVTPDWYPLELLSKISKFPKGSELGYWLTYSEAISVLCSAIVLYIGYKWYKHKQLKQAFFGNGKRFAMLAAVLVIVGGLLAFTLMPNKGLSHERTVIAGTVDSDIQLKNLYVMDNFISDTIAVIPIKDNKFHTVIDKDIPLDNYIVAFDSRTRTNVIIGAKDSLYFDIKLFKSGGKVDVTGTRLAENQYNEKLDSWSMVSYYLDQNQYVDDPEFFSSKLVEDWEEAIEDSDKFKTIDNYVPRGDYREKNNKLISVDYLGYWTEYLKKRAAMFPDEKTEESPGIKKIKEFVSLNDESLLSSESYFNYLKSQLIAENKEDIDEDTKSIQAIAKLPAGTFKDKLLYKQLKKSLEEASTRADREKLVAQYAHTFKDNRYTSLTLNNHRIIESLSKGMPAPLFDGTTIDNKQFNLAQLKGKYVVIDTWATWCGPCKYQSPYFEKFAIKYKKQPVQFVAASTDENIADWYVEAKTKSKSVLQLHVNEPKKFDKDYNVESIPRFILIGPAGNLINANMPFPSDQMFEKVLRDELGLDEAK